MTFSPDFNAFVPIIKHSFIPFLGDYIKQLIPFPIYTIYDNNTICNNCYKNVALARSGWRIYVYAFSYLQS